MHKIRDRVAFVSGVLITPVAGALATLASTYKGSYFNIVDGILFGVPAFVAAVLSLTSLVLVFRVLIRKNPYKLPILPPALFKYYVGGTDAGLSFYETKYHLLGSLNAAINGNFPTTKRRLEQVLEAQISITVAIPFVILCLPNYVYRNATATEEPVSVMVTNIEALKESTHVESTQSVWSILPAASTYHAVTTIPLAPPANTACTTN